MDVGLRQHPATHLLWLEKFVTRAGLEVRDSQLSVLSESQRTLCVKSHWGRDNNIGQQQNWSNTHRRRQDQGHLGIQNRKRRWPLLISKAKDANSVVTPLCLAQLDTFGLCGRIHGFERKCNTRKVNVADLKPHNSTGGLRVFPKLAIPFDFFLFWAWIPRPMWWSRLPESQTGQWRLSTKLLSAASNSSKDRNSCKQLGHWLAHRPASPEMVHNLGLFY